MAVEVCQTGSHLIDRVVGGLSLQKAYLALVNTVFVALCVDEGRHEPVVGLVCIWQLPQVFQ